MKQRLKTTIKLSAAGLFLLASPTYASENNCINDEGDVHYKHCDSQVGWYIGGELGHAQTDISQSDIDTFYDKTGFDANSIDVDDSDLAFSLMAGYQFNTYWAVEGAYIDLGERRVDFTGRAEDLDDFYDNVEHVYPQSGDGLSIAVVGSWVISEDFKLSGKLGYWRWEGDYTTYDTNGGVGSDSIKGNDLWFGAELNYRLSERMQVYLTAQRFSLDRDENNVFGLGVRYYFGGEYQATKTSEKLQPTETERVAVAVVAMQLDSDKDGVFDRQDNCTNSNVLHQVDVNGCTVIKEQKFSFNLTIYYANDSFEIPSSYDEKLQDLADYINEYKVKQLTIYGHTSAPGFRAYNMKLSQHRAQSIANILQVKFNINENIIKPIGRGEEELFDKSETDKAHQLNRRIELNIEEKLLLPVEK
ncbi:MAG: OmpA family protein [Colwellia sp.]|nr:OmpA family protein [Colwellia sp.]